LSVFTQFGRQDPLNLHSKAEHHGLEQ